MKNGERRPDALRNDLCAGLKIIHWHDLLHNFCRGADLAEDRLEALVGHGES